MNITDEQILNFIADNEAWLTFASDEVKDRSWRCEVAGRHFASPDRRERCGRIGYGNNPRGAAIACIKDRSGNLLCDAALRP